MWRRFATNALANLVSGASGTLYQIALTAIATHSFGQRGFAVWALALSMAALVPLFSANMSTLITRRLVESDGRRATAVMTAGRELSRALAVLSLIAVLALSFGLQAHAAPLRSERAGTFALLVLLLSIAQVWQLILQPVFGWHFAAERNWKVCGIIVLARIGALGSMALICWQAAASPTIAAAALAAGCIGGVFIGHAVDRGRRPPTSRRNADSLTERRAIAPLLRAFAVWALGSAAIQNGVPPFVSLIAPQGFNAFFIAYTINLIVVGIIASASSALLAPLARARVTGRVAAMERWLAVGPFATAATLCALISVLWFALPLILTHWSAGLVTAQQVRQPMVWLGAQTIARSTALLHSVLLSSSANPAQLRRPIIIEILLTIAIAAPLGYVHGVRIFLPALALAGQLTALYTAWSALALTVGQAAARTRLFFLFAGAQTVALGLWLVVTL